jgi:uncharacterized protein (DUF1015 family)
MAEVRAFRGLRYAPEAVGDPGKATCPPYDVMDAEAQRAFHEQSLYNAVRLELGHDAEGDTTDDNRYTRAAATLAAWRSAGVLRRDDAPCLYRYSQTFREASGGERTRTGLLTLLRLEEFESGVVLPHEETFPHHKEDRYRLLSACRAQISPIFGLFRSSDPALHARLREPSGEGDRAPTLDFQDEESVRHRVWPLADRALHAAYAADLRACQVFIADGHHRYETALRYRAECRRETPGASGAWFEYVMILLVEMGDPGLVVYPTHRILEGHAIDGERALARLRESFAVEPVPLPDAAEEAVAVIERAVRRHTLALVLPRGREAALLTLRDPAAMERVGGEHSVAWRDLDVSILHRLALPAVRTAAAGELSVRYTRDAAEALQAARMGAAAFLMESATVDDLRAVSSSGERMPEKSTYFFPKARTGLVFYDEGAGPG